MSNTSYPNYINQMLQQARELLAEPFEQADAAAICFDILALFPNHIEASELVYEGFCNPELIREQRKAISRLIDEWDDRDWQQRRRLALSFRHMCRWEGQYREYEDGEEVKPPDVAEMLDEGHHQLNQHYLLGQSKGSEVAWSIFQDAIQRTSDPAKAMLWIGEQYADQGFFAEAVEMLEDLLARFPKDTLAKRLWVEVRWWRDNQEWIPWIPPAGTKNGRRYSRMMADIDPTLADADPIMAHVPPDRDKLPPDFELPESLPDGLVEEITAVLNTIPNQTQINKSLVDWRYLDLLESGDIDTTQFPEWAQYLLLEIDNPEQEQFLKRYLLEHLSNPDLFDEEE